MTASLNLEASILKHLSVLGVSTADAMMYSTIGLELEYGGATGAVPTPGSHAFHSRGDTEASIKPLFNATQI
jgi:hypothetical protein